MLSRGTAGRLSISRGKACPSHDPGSRHPDACAVMFRLMLAASLAGLVAVAAQIHGAECQWTQGCGPCDPAPRVYHGLAYSGCGSVLLHGGQPSLEDTWTWDGTAWTPVPGANGPHRLGFGMDYDSDRHVVVLFGGYNGVWMNDTWEWSCQTQAWAPVTTNGAPSPRTDVEMAYDPSRGVMVLFGGSDQFGLLGDTWEYDGATATWTQRCAPCSPPPRRFHGMAYTGCGSVLMHAGEPSLEDTWKWDGSTWTLLPDANGPHRLGFGMVYDSGRDLVVLFGGYNGVWMNDTWEWDCQTQTWTQVATDGAPPPRSDVAMAYDLSRSVSVIFAGSDQSGSLGDTWELSCCGSADTDNDGAPDLCDNCPTIPNSGQQDCNSNYVGDTCDIAAGTSLDCQPNGIPDECDLGSGNSPDCNNNGCPDECELVPSIAFEDDDGIPYVLAGPNDFVWMESQPNGSGNRLDLNDDGHADLAWVSISGQTLSTLLGNGDGTFGPETTYSLEGTRPGALVAGKFDDDAHTDIVVGYLADAGFTPWLELFKNAGNGSGVLLPSAQIMVDFDCQDLVAADFDGDGRLDIINTTRIFTIPTFVALKNLGGGDFGDYVSFLAGPGARLAAVGDLDNDAWPDLAVSNLNFPQLHVFRNSGLGDFSASLFEDPVPYYPGDFPSFVTAADMDNDGHVDLVVSNTGEADGDPAFAILWNDGAGIFCGPSFYAGGEQPHPHAVADFDSDGDLDVAAGACSTDPFILQNKGQRFFVPIKGYSSGGFPCHIAAEDFNEDGRVDLANAQSAAMQILLNSYGPLSSDCNANGIPDECDIANCLPSAPECADCNDNGVPDECDLSGQVTKLIASDAAELDWFGKSVSIDGDTAVIGAPLDDDACPADPNCESGAAYVFVRVGGLWIPQQRLTAEPAPVAGEWFGASVAVSDNTIVIGADYEGGSTPGSAYVFVRSGGTWSQQQKLTPSTPAPCDRFGFSVAISVDTIVIGATQHHICGPLPPGAAYVFVRDGEVWTEQQKLTPLDSEPDDYFGFSVSVDGDTAVIGAIHADDACPTDPNCDSGAAYVFVRSKGQWSQVRKLIASDGAAEDVFGHSVSLDGNTILVGALYDDDAGPFSGSAYVFVGPKGGWPGGSPLTETRKLTASDAAAGDGFGNAVTIRGATAVIGAIQHSGIQGQGPGSAYVFSRPPGGWSTAPSPMHETSKLSATDGLLHDLFGASVSISGNTAVIGAYGDDHAGAADVGSAYIFDLESTSPDCNANAIPDECEPDCDQDGIPDECDPCCVPIIWCADPDDDGFGTQGTEIEACEAPPGYIANCTDNCPEAFNPSQQDCDANEVGDACEALFICSTNPPQGNLFCPMLLPLPPLSCNPDVFRDVLQTGARGQLTQGIGSPGTPSEGGVIYRPIHVTFSQLIALSVADITITCNFTGAPPGSTPCPVVPPNEFLDAGLGEFLITLDRPIPPGGCTTIRFDGQGQGLEIRYESLPGDVNMNGLTNTQDLLALVQGLNSGMANVPSNLARYDINRTGIANTQDLLRLVQLLNGTNTIRPWNGVIIIPCE